MSAAPSLGIPELAGLCTYEDAARIGFSVDDNVRRLLRFHWVERRLMECALAHLTSTPEWEVKCALALHQWQDAEHADAIRRRIAEMRSPMPSMDEPPNRELAAFLDELIRSSNTVELLTGVYLVARAELAAAYERHLGETNPLVDHPTRRMLRLALLEEEEALHWGLSALESLLVADDAKRAQSAAWEVHLRAYLAAAGGVDGVGEPAVPGAGSFSASRPFVPDFHPRRDARFRGLYNFNFPPHVVYNAPGVPADERNIALLCKRTLEMDVPEMMASFMIERVGQPWEFYREYARQLWDEARHAMMGTVAFEARGVDWTRIPLNVSFALRLNGHATALERQIMLFAIEQSLMPSETGKRFEYETAVAAGDALSAHFHDYDWADEVLHAQIGRRWMKREGITPVEAVQRTHEIHERTWAALDAYKGPDAQREWWSDFVEAVLGKESSVREKELGELKILAE